jgi:hypothetical protein
MVFDLTNLLFTEEPEKKKIYHIVKYGNNGWVLKERDSSEIIESDFNREALIINAFQRCSLKKCDLVIHDQNGFIEDVRTYGS